MRKLENALGSFGEFFKQIWRFSKALESFKKLWEAVESFRMPWETFAKFRSILMSLKRPQDASDTSKALGKPQRPGSFRKLLEALGGLRKLEEASGSLEKP